MSLNATQNLTHSYKLNHKEEDVRCLSQVRNFFGLILKTCILHVIGTWLFFLLDDPIVGYNYEQNNGIFI